MSTGFRIGHGFDVHAFEKGSHLILGGETIPFDKSFAAHSDGDVLLHAICDALLGAAALGDIGRHFPDTDPKFKGIDSRELLRKVHSLITESGYLLANVDATIVAQQPKLSPYIQSMQNNIANDLYTEINNINIKATTTEHLGYTGRGEGIAVHAVALLTSK
jgi:2-C-methyl-D-erythritol 2,4-cyclodiphosphate synthase